MPGHQYRKYLRIIRDRVPVPFEVDHREPVADERHRIAGQLRRASAMRCCASCSGSLNDFALAEDLAQETWLRAATRATRRRSTIRAASCSAIAVQPPRAIASATSAIASSSRAPPYARPCRPQPAETVTLHRSELARLLQVVEGLSPRCREVFVLGKFEGLSLAKIGALARDRPQHGGHPHGQCARRHRARDGRRQIIVTASHRFASQASNG